MLQIGYKSDVGKQRELDEDSLLIANLSGVAESSENEWTILAIADGAGGENSGEVASRIALRSVIERLSPVVFRKENFGFEEAESLLEEAIHYSHRKIVKNWQENPAREGMASTLSLALINGSDMYVGHVGDSRLYLITEDIQQVTKDHSYVQQLLEAGAITEEEVKDHPQKNVITQALGGKEEAPEADVYYRSLFDGDRVLICCDGVTDVVEDEEIRSIVANQNEGEACEKIVDLANERGGPDNISLLVATYVGEDGTQEAAAARETKVKKGPEE